VKYVFKKLPYSRTAGINCHARFIYYTMKIVVEKYSSKWALFNSLKKDI